MKCTSISASDTFFEMQYLWNIYGPCLVCLALKLSVKHSETQKCCRKSDTYVPG